MRKTVELDPFHMATVDGQIYSFIGVQQKPYTTSSAKRELYIGTDALSFFIYIQP